MKTEYEKQAHRMQAGVAYFEGKTTECSPKHLRVGINAAMADQAGLALLLIKKGIITEEEYIEAVTKSMTDEADRYENRAQQELSPNWEIDVRLKALEDIDPNKS